MNMLLIELSKTLLFLQNILQVASQQQSKNTAKVISIQKEGNISGYLILLTPISNHFDSLFMLFNVFLFFCFFFFFFFF